MYSVSDASLLSPSPDEFVDCGSIEAVPHNEVARQLHCDPNNLTSYYDFTPHGIRTQLPMIPLSLYLRSGATTDAPLSRWYLVILGCEHSDRPGQLLGRVCHIPASESSIQFLYCGQVMVPCHPPAGLLRSICFDILRSDSFDLLRSKCFDLLGSKCFDLLPLSLTTTTHLPSLQVDVKTVHIPHSNAIDEPRIVAFRKTHERICLVLPKKTRRGLYAQGYTATLQGADRDHPTTQWLTLLHSDKSHTIIIEYQHKLDDNGVELALEAHVRVAGPHGLRELDQEHAGTASWTDSYPWAGTLDTEVVVATVGSRRLEIVLDLRLETPDHYVPYVEIREESSILKPAPYWKRWLPAAADQSVGVSSERGREGEDNEETNEQTGIDGEAEAAAEEAVWEGEGGSTTDGKVAEGAGSWWAV